MMTSNTSQHNCLDNQTCNILETSTGFGNFTYRNHSGRESEISNNDLRSFEDDSFEIHEYSYSSSLFVLIAIGFIGNTLLFIMMRDEKLNHLSYSVYLKCLAVSDTTVLITRLIRETERMFRLQRIQLMNNVLCKLFFSTKFVVMLLSPWLVAGLTIDRYVCVCFPLTRDRLCTQKKATIVCLSMVTVSVLLTLPFLVTLELVDDLCRPDELKYYYIFFRLILSSNLPCIVILVLNVLIVVQIKRSYNFRNMFTRSTTDSTNRQQDSATRPLVLVSVLAFVTLLPLTISETVMIYLETFTTNKKGVILTKKIWRILFIIYILNFGQNFYILIASSSTYRDIIKRIFRCCSCRWVSRNEGKPSTTKHENNPVSVSGVPLPSLPYDNTSPAVEPLGSQSTELSIVM